ncbi:MAG TPA: GNAT family N-acetyltransferase [Alphaproteobacteria bacterium]|nr:GNAT family N-acetyltransferase [Alphaproteobacteria bacterium]
MHPLDNPTWSALTTHQSQIALVAGMARRFPPEVCVHGGVESLVPQAFQDLARLSPEPVGLFSLQKLQPPPGWTVTRAVELLQMVQVEPEASDLTRPHQSLSRTRDLADSTPSGGFLIDALAPSDLPELSALYEATRPGRKLSPGLYKLGGFVGIRDTVVGKPGKLVAMACLRLHLTGYCEISTVGTLPGFTGRGHATALVAELARRIRARNELPFLTVHIDNERAIRIYQRLGFRERIRMHSTTIRFG